MSEIVLARIITPSDPAFVKIVRQVSLIDAKREIAHQDGDGSFRLLSKPSIARTMKNRLLSYLEL